MVFCIQTSTELMKHLRMQSSLLGAPVGDMFGESFSKPNRETHPFVTGSYGIRYLFMFEKVAWARSPEERLRIRLEKEVPVIDELTAAIKAKLIDGKILPKSKFKEALGYYCSLIPYLKNYTLYPFARLDNNVAERTIRPLAIGRKNWLFVGSEEGGESASIIYSLVQTCRAFKINPRVYLEDVMRRLMGHTQSKIEELLPDRWLAAKSTSSQK
jgi:transposase